MRIYCDIDGTLTNKGGRSGEPVQKIIDKIKQLIDDGHTIIIWSGSGTRYAQRFCKKHGIKPFCTVGKPQLIIDNMNSMMKRGAHLYPDEFMNVNVKSLTKEKRKELMQKVEKNKKDHGSGKVISI